MAFVPPHNLEAEQSLLGAILLHGDALEAASEIVTPEDFYRQAHGTIYRHAQQLASKRQPVDLVTVKNALLAAGVLEDVNGPAYLASLVDGMPRTTNVVAYARIVREKAVLRELIQQARQTLEAAANEQQDAAVVLDQAQQRLYQVAVDRAAGGFVSISDVVSGEVLPLVEALIERKQVVSGIATGLIDLDYLTRGFQPSDLVLLAARPSMGKTALAMSAALHAATLGRQHVGVFSLEMSRRDLGLRAVIAEARIDGTRVRAGRIYDSEWTQWTQAIGIVAEAWLHIDDSSQLTVNDIRTRARRLKAQVGLDLIVVDYLQLIHPSERKENRNLEMGEVSAGLKGIAKDLQVPVLALSQLSRACEARSDKRPMLSDLRDSGALEQDADVVLFIYRDEVYHHDTTETGIAEVSIAKHRNGPIGTVKVGFDRHQTRFFNLAGRTA